MLALKFYVPRSRFNAITICKWSDFESYRVWVVGNFIYQVKEGSHSVASRCLL